MTIETAAPFSADRAHRLRRQVLVASWWSYAGFYLTRKVFSVVKGPLRDALHVDDLAVSHLFTAYLTAYMIGQFVAGALSRRFGNRTLLVWGMGVSAACTFVMGIALQGGAPAYSLLLLCMTVHGLAQATGWPCNVGLMAKWTHKDERGTIMALWGTCYQIGGVLGKALAAWVFALLGLAWPFITSSVLLLAVIALFIGWGRESPRAAGLPADAFDDNGARDARAADAIREASDAPVDAAAPSRQTVLLIVAMGVIYFAFKALRYALDSWSALLMAEQFGLSTSTAGFLSASFDWVGFVGVMAAGVCSDRLYRGARLPVIVFMTLGTLIGTVALWAFGLQSPTVFVVLLGVIGFMAMGPDSLLSGAVAMDVGSARHAALAAGVINGCGSLGPIVQEPLVAWLKQSAGIHAVLVLLVVLMSAAFVGTSALHVIMRKRGVRM